MFPPVPATFAGSLPAPPAQAPTALGAPALLDRALSGLALLCGAAAFCGVALRGGQVVSADGVKLICAATLAPALLGMWLLQQLQEEPALAITRICSLVQYRLQMGDRLHAVARHPLEESYGGLAALIADTVASLRRLQAGCIRSKDAAASADLAIQSSREQAGALAETLRRDAMAMADAASGIMVASARLAEDAAATRLTSNTARQIVDQAITRANGLTQTVTALTGQLGRMTTSASSAAQAAFATHASVAGLAGRAAALAGAGEAAGRALAEAHASPARAKALAAAAEAAVAEMQVSVADLQTELALAVQHAVALSDVIHAQQEAGVALSHAVERQGNDIGEVLALMRDAHAGLDRVQADMESVSRHGADRQADAEAIRGAANRLPAHADVIAGILRNIPDFTPP